MVPQGAPKHSPHWRSRTMQHLRFDVALNLSMEQLDSLVEDTLARSCDTFENRFDPVQDIPGFTYTPEPTLPHPVAYPPPSAPQTAQAPPPPSPLPQLDGDASDRNSRDKICFMCKEHFSVPLNDESVICIKCSDHDDSAQRLELSNMINSAPTGITKAPSLKVHGLGISTLPPEASPLQNTPPSLAGFKRKPTPADYAGSDNGSTKRRATAKCQHGQVLCAYNEHRSFKPNFKKNNGRHCTQCCNAHARRGEDMWAPEGLRAPKDAEELLKDFHRRKRDAISEAARQSSQHSTTVPNGQTSFMPTIRTSPALMAQVLPRSAPTANVGLAAPPVPISRYIPFMLQPQRSLPNNQLAQPVARDRPALPPAPQPETYQRPHHMTQSPSPQVVRRISDRSLSSSMTRVQSSPDMASYANASPATVYTSTPASGYHSSPRMTVPVYYHSKKFSMSSSNEEVGDANGNPKRNKEQDN